MTKRSFLLKTDDESDTFKCGRCFEVFLEIDEFTNHKKRKTCKRKQDSTSYYGNLATSEGI